MCTAMVAETGWELGDPVRSLELLGWDSGNVGPLEGAPCCWHQGPQLGEEEEESSHLSSVCHMSGVLSAALRAQPSLVRHKPGGETSTSQDGPCTARSPPGLPSVPRPLPSAWSALLLLGVWLPPAQPSGDYSSGV